MMDIVEQADPSKYELDLGMRIAFKAVIQLPYWLILTP